MVFQVPQPEPLRGVERYENKTRQMHAEADYAKIYKETEVIDFRGNVKLTSHHGHFLETEQLFYDQKKEWFFTKQKFKFTAPGEGETIGMGVDFSKDFQRIDFKNVNGMIEKLE